MCVMKRVPVPESPHSAARGMGIGNWKNWGAAVGAAAVPQFPCVEWPGALPGEPGPETRPTGCHRCATSRLLPGKWAVRCAVSTGSPRG